MKHDGKHRRFDPFEGGVSRREMVIGGSSLLAGVALAATGVAGAEPKQSAAAHRAAVLPKPSSSAEDKRSTPRARAAEEERASRSDARREPPEQVEEEEKPKPKRGRNTAALPAAILTTSDWDARKPDRKADRRSGPPKFIVIHHTTTDNVDDFSESRAKWLAKAVQNAHMSQGWGDTGQQFTVSRGGYVLEGRHGAIDAVKSKDLVVGVHVAGLNDYAVGIECEGNYNKTLPPKELRASLVRLCAWLCEEYGLDPHKAIVPHRKFNPTDCCGSKFARTIPQLRKAVAKAIDGKGDARKRDEERARREKDARDRLREAREEARERAARKDRVTDDGPGPLAEFLFGGRR